MAEAVDNDGDILSEQEKTDQIKDAASLQGKLLKHFIKLFDSGSITSTDLATLERLLSKNGWTLDPTRVPKKLKDKLTAHLNPKDIEDSGGKILQFRAGAK